MALKRWAIIRCTRLSADQPVSPVRKEISWCSSSLFSSDMGVSLASLWSEVISSTIRSYSIWPYAFPVCLFWLHQWFFAAQVFVKCVDNSAGKWTSISPVDPTFDDISTGLFYIRNIDLIVTGISPFFSVMVHFRMYPIGLLIKQWFKIVGCVYTPNSFNDIQRFVLYIMFCCHNLCRWWWMKYSVPCYCHENCTYLSRGGRPLSCRSWFSVTI